MVDIWERMGAGPLGRIWRGQRTTPSGQKPAHGRESVWFLGRGRPRSVGSLPSPQSITLVSAMLYRAEAN